MKKIKNNEEDIRRREKANRMFCKIANFFGLPLVLIGVGILIGTFVYHYTPNWLLASGFICVLIGTIVYFEQIKRKSRF